LRPHLADRIAVEGALQGVRTVSNRSPRDTVRGAPTFVT
jgi:hypothetical protein